MRSRDILLLSVPFLVQLVSAPISANEKLSPREQLLQQGEAALAAGAFTQALQAFERAASMLHAADAEMGLVRAYMQSGAYQSALSFAAHAAGAHRDTPAASALYAWLLHIGGQRAFAQRVLDESDARRPGDSSIAQVRASLRSPAPVASGELLKAPWRAAPFDTGAPLPAPSRGVSSGALIDGGRHALTSIVEGQDFWVRDGLGRRSKAQVERRVVHLGLMLLRLHEPLMGASGAIIAPRDPYPGSPGFSVDYSPTTDAAPAWPLLHAGFVGAPDGSGILGKLGVELPAGAQGGPLFDSSGRLIGIAVRGANGQDGLLPVSVLRGEFGAMLQPNADASPTKPLPTDAIYQGAMPIALQIIAAPE